MYSYSFHQAVVALLTILWAVAPAQADLEFVEPSADAGDVKAGAPLSHQFTFVNRGPEVVEITGIESSCGCLTPRLDRRTFQPGEHGSILVEINTLSPAPGPHTWQVKLSCRTATDDPPSNTHHSRLTTHQWEIPLRLTARLVREIVVEPAAVNMFVDGPMQTELRLIDLRSPSPFPSPPRGEGRVRGPKPLQLQEVHTSAPGLQARLAGQERDASGHLVSKVQLTIAGDIADGRHEEFVSLFTNDPDYREIKVPVTIVKRPRQRLSATPSRIELPLRPGASLPARMVLIRDRENQEVEVEAVSPDSPAITCRWAKGPGTMTTVRIQVDRNQIQDSTWESTVRVQVVKPTRQTLLIAVIVTGPE